MVTISHLVKGIVEKKPFLEEALNRGIINYGALADVLLPEIEKELKKKVKHSAVMMALRRYSETAGKKLLDKAKFEEDTDISMRSGLVEVTIVKTPGYADVVKKFYDFVDTRNGDFISVIQGVHEISVITNKKHEKDVLRCVKKADVKDVNRELSSLTINIPENSTETVGLFYVITRALSWENLPIVEIISTWTEMTYIFNTDDASKAFTVIKKLIDENK